MDGALPARARGLRHARPHAGEGATTFELFFDLVYVFAVTQVTDLISHEHGAEGLPRARCRGGAARPDPVRDAVVDLVHVRLAGEPAARRCRTRRGRARDRIVRHRNAGRVAVGLPDVAARELAHLQRLPLDGALQAVRADRPG
ncbi:low temperature requirement protein A [Propionibacterium freudenreichii]|nr:low temperature requirement protein A [Propionibacterium freudenreichii]MDK9359724.1 low temperature requirement protein A [Propionibacterium freudenreichii]MDK9640207.1 low temperature requirement protein A [Propionibacterium freudenreichii]